VADRRLKQLHEAGETSARLYGESPDDGVGGQGAFFLLLDEPEVYGLPPAPVVTTRDLPAMWKKAATAAAMLLVGIGAAFAGGTPMRGGADETRRAVDGAAGRLPVVLRPTDPQAADMGSPRHRRLPLPRRPGRRVVDSRGRRAPDIAPGFARASKLGSTRRDHIVGGRTGARPRRPARFANMLRVFKRRRP